MVSIGIEGQLRWFSLWVAYGNQINANFLELQQARSGKATLAIRIQSINASILSVQSEIEAARQNQPTLLDNLMAYCTKAYLESRIGETDPTSAGWTEIGLPQQHLRINPVGDAVEGFSYLNYGTEGSFLKIKADGSIEGAPIQNLTSPSIIMNM